MFSCIRVNFVLCCVMFMLAACGGGGGGSITAMRPNEQPPMTTQDTQTAFGTGGERPQFSPLSSRPSIRGRLQQSDPAFGSVAMNLYTPGFSPVRSAETTFTGDRFTLSVQRQNGSVFTLDTARHYAERTADSSTTTNPVTNRPFAFGYLASVSGNQVALAGGVIEWSRTDVTDYMAGGYWMTIDASTLAVDMGAFIDGTDYPSPNDVTNPLPVTGSAVYRGLAGGLYVAAAGTDTPLPGSTEIGEYSGRATLVANFEDMRIGGHVDQVQAGGGVITLSDGTQYATQMQPTDFIMFFRPVPINQNGTFFGDNVTFTSQQYAITSSSGSWAGQFSNVDDARGNPRAAAGTNTGYLETVGGSRAILTGAFYGATERFE